MFNDLPPEFRVEEIERNAYNAAFYELGLRWFWDVETYAALLRVSADASARIRHYLETRQPHLLTAYDADFLARAIQDAMRRHKGCAAPSCDWSKLTGCELGI
ncbi:hypothetical protein [Azohydromonas caseinilytica]|uniref:Uncharacterized protein n=1 Tax=Azohydromonas caseinilytica TaxID=2728836 RepID=A0A848FHZ3_9BURK|nr:hypothetical protein [Azohydromonas caseinilytica]NML17883.1 hypothetical protein [Azohydromonas caseinilytica]